MSLQNLIVASRRGLFPVAVICFLAGSPLLAAPPDKRLIRQEEHWRKPIPEPEFARFADWTERFEKSQPAARSAAEPEGLTLARERRRAMADLIRANPERALELAVPSRVRKSLPKHIAAELEEPVSGRGELDLFAVLAEPGKEALVKPNFWKAKIKGREFDAFVYGRRLGQPTRKNIPLHGVAVDGVIAIGENPARVLDADETEEVKQARAAEPVCGTSGLPSTTYADETALDVGGQVYFFCQSTHAEAFNDNLIQAEENTPLGDSGGGTVDASAWTEGRKNLILIRVDFPDLTNAPFSDAIGTNLVTGLNNFYSEMSYGRAGFSLLGQGSEMTPTFRMAQPAAYYGTNNFYSQLRTQARAAASAAGYVLTNYQFDLICMGAVPGFNWSGLGSVGGAGAWIRASFGTGVSAHELGHNFGLNHANYWDTLGQSIIGTPGTNVEYGDTFDTMGAASAGNNHFNSRYKNYLNWLTTNEVTKITSSGMYRVYAHDQTNTTGGVRGLWVVKNSSTNYWVELRQKFTSNKWLMSGAGLRWTQNGNGKSMLLDTTPGSTDAKNDACIVIGRTFSDPVPGIHITPIGKGGTTPESLDVVVNLGTFPTNLPPTVTVTASATNTATVTPLTFNAAANDANGDALAYYWDFGDGTFGTNSPNASKSWSSAGEYVVRCTASDMKGGVASDSVIVRIGSPTTYRISGQVTGNSGPAQGVRVYVSSARMTYTDSDGTYNLVGLPAGSYTLAASLYGYSFTNFNFVNPVSVGPNATNKNISGAAAIVSPPTIVSQPQSVEVSVGDQVAFSVIVTGTPPFSLQWRFNGANIPGANASDYVFLNAQTTNAGNYSVVVSNSAGVATSTNATLTVNTSAIITSQPHDTTVIAGGTAQFSVSATGVPPLTYQWWHGGSTPVGSNNSVLVVTNVQVADAGDYLCVVTSRQGLIMSDPATLTVNFTLTATATSGGSVTKFPGLPSYPPGSIVTLTATPVGAYLFSGWSGGATGTNNPLLVTVTSNLSITANFASPVADLIVDNPQATLTGSWTAATSAADKYNTNYVTAAATTGNASATATFRPNIPLEADYDVYVWHPTFTRPATVPVTISAAGATNIISVNQSASAGTWVPIATNLHFAAGTNAFVRIANTTSQANRNVAADAVKWSYSANQIGTPPVIVTPPADQAVAAGTDVDFSVFATGTGALNYQWQLNGTNLPGAIAATRTCTNVTSASAGVYTVIVSNNLGMASSSATLTVNTPPLLHPIADRSVHAGGTLAIACPASESDALQTLTFTFAASSVGGASIDATTGEFTWATTAADAGTTNSVTITVTDDGTPALSDEKNFLIRVLPPPEFQTVTYSNGIITMTWSAISGGVYRVQSKSGTNGSTWQDISPDVIATGPAASKSDTPGAEAGFYRILVVP